MKNFKSFVLVGIFGSLVACSGLAVADITVTFHNQSFWAFRVATGTSAANKTCYPNSTCTYTLKPNHLYPILYENSKNNNANQIYTITTEAQSYSMSCYTSHYYKNHQGPFYQLQCWND